MTNRLRTLLAAGAALLAAAAGASPLALPLAAQQVKLPDLRPLAPILARTTEPMGAVSTIAPLPGGRVLVNDILGRRVVMFDSTLAMVGIVADSTSATENAYGARGGGLLSYRGDSALFIDPASLTMSFLQAIRTACLQDPSYLDRFYSMQLGRPKGAKHIVIRLPWSARDHAGLDWIDDVGQFASIVWTGENIPSEEEMTEELEAHEFVLS